MTVDTKTSHRQTKLVDKSGERVTGIKAEREATEHYCIAFGLAISYLHMHAWGSSGLRRDVREAPLICCLCGRRVVGFTDAVLLGCGFSSVAPLHMIRTSLSYAYSVSFGHGVCSLVCAGACSHACVL